MKIFVCDYFGEFKEYVGCKIHSDQIHSISANTEFELPTRQFKTTVSTRTSID